MCVCFGWINWFAFQNKKVEGYFQKIIISTTMIRVLKKLMVRGEI